MPEHAIVVGVDGSPMALAALSWAAEEARSRQTGLRLVHAWRPPIRFPAPLPDDPMTRDAEARASATLSEAVRSVAGIAPVEALLTTDPAANALLHEAEHCDLLVVGARGHGGFAGLLLGSVSQRCAEHARCPVAVIRPPEQAVDLRIVVGVDGSPEARTALRWAVDEAHRRGYRVDVVAAWQRPWPGPRQKIDLVADAVESHANEAVAEAVAEFEDDPVMGTRLVVEDKPGLALVEAAKGASLLVVGARGLGGFTSLAFGSVSQACLHHAHGSVVIVH